MRRAVINPGDKTDRVSGTSRALNEFMTIHEQTSHQSASVPAMSDLRPVKLSRALQQEYHRPQVET